MSSGEPCCAVCPPERRHITLHRPLTRFCICSAMVDVCIPPSLACGLQVGPFVSLTSKMIVSFQALVASLTDHCNPACVLKFVPPLRPFQFAWTHRRKFILWIDNQLVHDRIKQFHTGVRGRPSLKQADHDLWDRMYIVGCTDAATCSLRSSR